MHIDMNGALDRAQSGGRRCCCSVRGSRGSHIHAEHTSPAKQPRSHSYSRHRTTGLQSIPFAQLQMQHPHMHSSCALACAACFGCDSSVATQVGFAYATRTQAACHPDRRWHLCSTTARRFRPVRPPDGPGLELGSRSLLPSSRHLFLHDLHFHFPCLQSASAVRVLCSSANVTYSARA